MIYLSQGGLLSAVSSGYTLKLDDEVVYKSDCLPCISQIAGSVGGVSLFTKVLKYEYRGTKV